MGVKPLLEILVAIVLQLAFRITGFMYQKRFTPEHYGDDLTHLSMVKEFKRTHGKKIDFTWMYPLTKSDYPSGFHYLVYLTRIPMKLLEQYGGLLPVLFDSILLLFFFIILHGVLGLTSWWFVLMPFCRLFYEHDGRSIHFSERAFGMLAGSVYLICLHLIIATSTSVGLYAIALLGFFLAIMSSKFAIQAIIFFSVLLSIFSASASYIGGLLLCLLIVMVFSKKQAIEVLSGVLRHSRFYRRVFMHINPAIKNHYKDLLLLLRHPTNLDLLFSNSLLKIIWNNPFNLAVIYCSLNTPFDAWQMFAWCGIALTVLIAWRPLTFLGEPERYLEYSLLPSFIVFVVYESILPLGLKLFIFFLFVFIFVRHYLDFVRRCNWQKRTQQFMPTIRHWFSGISSSTILTIPMRYGLYVGYNMLPDDSNKILVLHTNVGEGEAMRQYEDLLGDVYPYTNRDVDGLIEQFGIDYILVDKAAVAYLHSSVGEYYERFNKYEIVNESPIFMLVKPKI